MITFWQQIPHTGDWMQISEPQFHNVRTFADAMLGGGNTTLEIRLATREEPEPIAAAPAAAARSEGGPQA